MLVKFTGVSKRYDEWPALDLVDLEIRAGDFVIISGPSGAGKSTLLRLIYMDDLPSEGVVEVAGFRSDRIKTGDLPLLRRKLGVVFQDFKLLESRTIFENVALPLQASGIAPKAVRKRVFSILAEMGMSHRRQSYPLELSGGEQQRVAIARAMVAYPKLLLADEPTGNLDPEVSAKVIELLLEINRAGTAVILATHDQRAVPSGVARYLYLDNGRLINPGIWQGYRKK